MGHFSAEIFAIEPIQQTPRKNSLWPAPDSRSSSEQVQDPLQILDFDILGGLLEIRFAFFERMV